MFEFDSNLVMAIFIYLGACYILYNYKPRKIFDERGNFKNFGLNKNETVFPYWLVTTFIGLSSYYFMIIQKNNSF